MSKRGKIIVLVVANFILLLVTYWGVDCYVDNKADKLKDDAVAKLDSISIGKQIVILVGHSNL